MKKAIISLLNYLPLLLLGQIKLINHDSLRPDSNLLYLMTENHLEMIGLKNTPGLKITSKKSDVIINENEIVITPNKIGIDTLRIFRGSKLVSINIFYVDKIPDPLIQFASSSDTIQSINRILANPFLAIKFPNSFFKSNYRILSFQCTTIKKTKEQNLFTTLGGKLSEEMIAAIKKLVHGETIYLDDIRAGGCARLLPPITIQIL